jgi:uncharacterized protein YcnI
MRKFAAVVAGATIAVAGLAGPALAHVTVNPRTAEQGSYAKVAFRVPNERDNAGTTKLQVDLPMDHPLSSVSVRPLPGWDVKVEKSKLDKPIQAHGGELTEAVSRITWSGGKIQPGQFQEFDVSMGPLPTGTDKMLFKAVQTYSNGEVVRWDQEPAAGGEEPEHPAPVLTLTPKGQSEAPAAQPARVDLGAAASGDAEDGTARLLGWLGLGAGVIGAGLGGFGLARARGRS